MALIKREPDACAMERVEVTAYSNLKVIDIVAQEEWEEDGQEDKEEEDQTDKNEGEELGRNLWLNLPL